jgi:hypothetical protein
MIPLRDNIPARRVPVVRLLLIGLNVWGSSCPGVATSAEREPPSTRPVRSIRTGVRGQRPAR